MKKIISAIALGLVATTAFANDPSPNAAAAAHKGGKAKHEAKHQTQNLKDSAMEQTKAEAMSQADKAGKAAVAGAATKAQSITFPSGK